MAGLKRTLGLLDTVSLSLGAIIGAGIFVVIGIAARVAGPSLIVSIVIAGIIAALTGISVSHLLRAFPKEGGQYEYGSRTLSPSLGFLSGWMWCLNKIVTDSVIALGFATYASLFLHVPIQVMALLIIAIIMVINYLGVRTTGNLINLLVIAKVAILLFFVFVGLFYIKPVNFTPFAANGAIGILQASAIIFFAYVGFIRPIYVVEEVKEPKKNVPRGIFLGLAIAAIIYVTVTFVAVGLVGSSLLGSSSSPLALAISVTKFPYAIAIVSIGAIIATFSVLLGDVLGLSRMIFAMGRKGDYPKWLGQISKSKSTPRNAIILSGILIAIPTLFFDLKGLVQVASFLILVYFAFVNLSAAKHKLKIKKSALIPILGIIGTLALAFSLSLYSILIGFALIIAGIIYFSAKSKISSRL